MSSYEELKRRVAALKQVDREETAARKAVAAQENAEVARHGTINSVSERLRNSRMQQQNKLQRPQIDPERMDITALNQYKRVKCVSDLHKFYKI